ncbi:MAG: hypothetical protein QW647_06205, partial [Candidatus Bathyarchaeia archaeon]
MSFIKLLFKEECSLSKGLKKERIVSFGETEIAYIQPCASEKGKVTADIVMSKEEKEFFNFEVLCLILDLYKIMFAEERCSQALGTAIIKWRGRDIIIFKNGRINIKRALNKEEIEKILDSLIRLLLGSIICENCKKPLIDCAFGKCKKCMNIKEELKINEEAFKKYLTGLFLIKSLNKLHEVSKKTLMYSFNSTIFDKPKLIEIYRNINDSAFEALNCIIGASTMDELSLGLIVLSLVINFKIIIQKILERMHFLSKEETLKALILTSKIVLGEENKVMEVMTEFKNKHLIKLAINEFENLLENLNQLKFIS